MNMEPSWEQLELEASPEDRKLADDLLISVWFYFGLPSEYLDNINELKDIPPDEEFTFWVSKAVVVHILKHRREHASMFEDIFVRCSSLGNEVLQELDKAIFSSEIIVLKNPDPFSAFIKFFAILSDFILFLRWKGNFLNLTRKRLVLYAGELYATYFEDQMMDRGGLKALKIVAIEKARDFKYSFLQDFISKYCNHDAPFNFYDSEYTIRTEIQSE